MKVAFGTDWHLDFLSFNDRRIFLKEMNNFDVDAFIISGDISVSHYLEEHLTEINNLIDKPFYFVNGNHDFFGSSFWDVRDKVRKLSIDLKNVHWLEYKSVQLTNKTAMLGVDGWYDCGYGDYFFSGFEMMDFNHIKEFKFKNKEERLKVFQFFAEVGSSNIRRDLPKILENNDFTILVTHVPPFKRLCKYNGKQTNNKAIPYFCSKIIGDAIIEVKDKYPNKELLVLCGHTHNEATFSINNMNCICASAKYGNPGIYSIIEIF